MSQAYEDKLDGKIDEQMWADLHTKYKTQQEALERQRSAHLTADRTYLQQGVQILELANKAYDLYVRQPHDERAKLLQFLLLNSTLKDGNLCPTYRKPFDMLAHGVSHQLRREQWDLNHDHWSNNELICPPNSNTNIGLAALGSVVVLLVCSSLQMPLGAAHRLTDIVFVHNVIAVKNFIGFMAADLSCGLAGNPGARHVPHGRTPEIVKEPFHGGPGFATGGLPCFVERFDGVSTACPDIPTALKGPVKDQRRLVSSDGTAGARQSRPVHLRG